MARSVREELIGVRLALDRYFIGLHKEFQRIGYPKQAAFAKHIARGTLSAPPTAEDPEEERVGRFVNRQSSIDKYILSSSVRACDHRTLRERARGINISVGAYSRALDKLLRELKGYLSAFDEMSRAA